MTTTKRNQQPKTDPLDLLSLFLDGGSVKPDPSERRDFAALAKRNLIYRNLDRDSYRLSIRGHQLSEEMISAECGGCHEMVDPRHIDSEWQVCSSCMTDYALGKS